MAKKLFSKDHEWVELIDGSNKVRVGITVYAQDSLGDIVYVELPILKKQFDKDAQIAVVESAKAASDIYAPLTGNVVEVNNKLEDNPGLINESPETDGWIFVLENSNAAEFKSQLDTLMSKEDYDNYTKDL